MALLIALAESRPILLLDEWAAEQDPVFRRFFYREQLPALSATGKTVVAISHDDSYFEQADRLFEMRAGELIELTGKARTSASADAVARISRWQKTRTCRHLALMNSARFSFAVSLLTARLCRQTALTSLAGFVVQSLIKSRNYSSRQSGVGGDPLRAQGIKTDDSAGASYAHREIHDQIIVFIDSLLRKAGIAPGRFK